MHANDCYFFKLSGAIISVWLIPYSNKTPIIVAEFLADDLIRWRTWEVL